MKKYLLKELKYNFYWLDLNEGWGEDWNLAKFFHSTEEAEEEMKKLGHGIYVIETIYMQ